MTTTTGTQTPYLIPERHDRITVKTTLGNWIDMAVTKVTQIDDGTANLAYTVTGKVICGGKVTTEKCTGIIRRDRDWRSASN